MQTTKLIGSSPLVANYAYSCSFLNLNSIYSQSLRWKRKPIWLPTAKSKVFRVPVKPKIPKDEFMEIQRLYNNYRTYLRSVRAYFIELAKKNAVELDQSVIAKAEEDDYNQCFKINEEWNKKIAAEREVRLAHEREARRLLVLEKMELKKRKDEKINLEVERKIKEAKIIVPTLITRNNIDQAIEDALSEITDHNKALDLDGNWYTDKSGLSIAKKPEKIQINQ